MLSASAARRRAGVGDSDSIQAFKFSLPRACCRLQGGEQVRDVAVMGGMCSGGGPAPQNPLALLCRVMERSKAHPVRGCSPSRAPFPAHPTARAGINCTPSAIIRVQPVNGMHETKV